VAIPDDIRPDDRRLFWLLDRARTALRTRLETLVQERTGVSAAQIGALFYLGASRPDASDGSESPGYRPGELAAALGLTAAAATGLLDRMEAAGLAQRRADARDGRASTIVLTAAGRRAAERARPIVRALQDELSAGFDEHELATVSRFLRTAIERAPSLGAAPTQMPRSKGPRP
jgi:DNA-binding MarR family transcriptional regulator